MLNKRPRYWKVLVLIISAELLSLSVSAALSPSKITIANTGTISPTMIAKSGSAYDIQTAVDLVAAAGGGNVSVPAGTWNFTPPGTWTTVNVPAGVNIFGAANQRFANGSNTGWNTVLRMSWDAPGTVDSPSLWFELHGTADPHKISRFSDLELDGNGVVNASTVYASVPVEVDEVVDFRIDHCYFNDLRQGIFVGSNSAYQGKNMPVCGLIDHNKLINTGGDPGAGYAYSTKHTVDYGIMPYGTSANDASIWDPNPHNVLGYYTNFTVVIENNYFSYWRHCVSANNGMSYVFRFNTVVGDCGIGTCDGHQAYTIISTRSMEIYNNTFLDPNYLWDTGSIVVNLRGGACVFFNNTVRDYEFYIGVVAETAPFPEGNPGLSPDCPVYCWNNVNLHGGTHYDQIRAVELDASGQGNVVNQTSMPDYTPLPYPFPLDN